MMQVFLGREQAAGSCLFKVMQIGDEIPEDLFKAVARFWRLFFSLNVVIEVVSNEGRGKRRA